MPAAAGATLYFDRDMEEGEQHAVAGGQATVLSARCPGKQTPNEDAGGVIPLGDGCAVLVVADGMGGAAAGEQAAQLAVETLCASLEQHADEPLRGAIMNGIEAANHAVSALGVGTATTLAVAEIQNGCVRPYHVGDSMILVVGQRRKIKLQTVSHSPVGYAVEAGLINESEALHHEDRHLVSNTIGAPDMRIEVGSTIQLAARDSLLLASDGLFDNLLLEEIVEGLRKGPLPQAVQRLASSARQRMQQPRAGQPSKSDDLTLVAYRPTYRTAAPPTIHSRAANSAASKSAKGPGPP